MLPISLGEEVVTRPIIPSSKLELKQTEMPFQKECDEIIEFADNILSDP
jgi:hypothetical protein